MKKVGIGCLTIIIIIVVLGIIGASGSSNKTSTSTTQQNGTNNAPTQAQEQVAGLNETVQDGDLAFTVVEVNKKKTLGNQFITKTAQGMYYIVTLKLENKGKKTVTFDSSMAKVMDSESREFERSIDGQTGLGMTSGKVDLFLQQIQPTLSYTGDLVFDLPEAINSPVLSVKGGLFNKGAKIKLQ